MGYKSRIYIVRKSNQFDPKLDKVWAEVLMMFNLGRVSVDLEDWYREQKPTDCFICADDGDTPIIEDCIGDPLKEISLFDLRNSLLLEMKQGHYSDSTMILATGVLDTLIHKYGTDHARVTC